MIPRFARYLEEQIVKEHKSGEFVCEVYPPKSEIKWMLDNEQISKTKKYQIASTGGERRLSVKDVCEDDQGIVSAVLDHERTEARLVVQGTNFSECTLKVKFDNLCLDRPIIM